MNFRYDMVVCRKDFCGKDYSGKYDSLLYKKGVLYEASFYDDNSVWVYTSFRKSSLYGRWFGFGGDDDIYHNFDLFNEYFIKIGNYNRLEKLKKLDSIRKDG
jgi:hypothetical protein